MAKLKYDVSNIEDVPDLTQPPVGVYRAKVEKVELGNSSKGNEMITVVYKLTHAADGTKLKEAYSNVWDRVLTDHDNEFVQARFKDFITTFVGKAKGELDLNKLVGATCQVKLKSDNDQDGEYRPRVGKVMPLKSDDEPAEDEEEAEEVEEEEVDVEEEEAESLEDTLNALDRQGLKDFIKENDEVLSDDEGVRLFKVLKSDDEDSLREKILSVWPEDEEADEEDEEAEEEEEEEDDEESEEEDDDNVDYNSWSLAQLKAEAAERELSVTGAKKILAARLKKDDETSAI